MEAKNNENVVRTDRMSLHELETMTKVTSLREKFEKAESAPIAKVKPATLPKKNVLLRSETMRTDSFLYRNREEIKLPTVPIETEHSVDDTIYDNVPISPISWKNSDKNSFQDAYENVACYSHPVVPIRSSSLTSQTSRNSIKLINENLQSLQITTSEKLSEISKKPFRMLSELKEVLKRKESVRLPTGLGNSRKSLYEESQKPIAYIPPQIVSKRESASSFESFDDGYYEQVATPNDSLGNNVTKIERIIRELIDNEKSYVATLEHGINDYITKFDEISLPNALKGQRINIFSNIENIHHFHKNRFYPQILECGFVPENIAGLFSSFLDDSHFDKYIIYVLNRKKSEKLCKDHKYFFKQIQKDRLGINSFLLQPIQRIPRYQLILGELIKELMKDLDNNKDAIGSLCIAEKKIQRLLNTINEYCET